MTPAARRWLRPATAGEPTARQRLGQRGERLAQQVLRAAGYRIERTNVRFPIGEIDILAWEGRTLCFVEVRSSSSPDWGGPLASIDGRKRRRVIRAAQWYLNRCRELPRETRFDVVAIEWMPDAQPTVELIRGAFDAG